MSPERLTIITDTAANVPQSMVNKYNIKVARLNVNIIRKGFPTETFKDGELDGTTFTKKLRDKSLDIKTSAPEGGEYVRIYESTPGPILAIHITGAKSATLKMDQTAAELMERKNDVTFFDSETLSWPTGKMVILAAQLAEQGMSVNEILPALHKLRMESTALAILGTLDYLRRGGRLSLVKYVLGKAAGVIPILRIDNNDITQIGSAANMKKAVKSAIELVLSLNPKELCVMHGGDEKYKEKALGIAEGLSEQTGLTVTTSPIGSVLEAHSGPEVLGLGVISNQPIPEEIKI